MKTFTKVSLILLVSLVLVLGSTSLYAQDDVKKDVEKKAACKEHAEKGAACCAAGKCEHKTVYACPEEGCKYKSDKPGKCPKCGKELVKKELCCQHGQQAHEAYYVCPMKQCNYKSDKPGKCPKCGMELKKIVPAAACCKKAEKACEHAEHEKKD